MSSRVHLLGPFSDKGLSISKPCISSGKSWFKKRAWLFSAFSMCRSSAKWWNTVKISILLDQRRCCTLPLTLWTGSIMFAMLCLNVTICRLFRFPHFWIWLCVPAIRSSTLGEWQGFSIDSQKNVKRCWNLKMFPFYTKTLMNAVLLKFQLWTTRFSWSKTRF